MPARRMPGHINLLRIAAIVANVRVNPADRGGALANLVGNRGTRDQIVIDDDSQKTGAAEAESDIRAILLIVADPIAAVDVDLHWSEARAAAGPENVEPFTGGAAVRHIEHAGHRLARPRALLDPARAMRLQHLGVNFAGVVVLAVERGAVVVAEDGVGHAWFPVTLEFQSSPAGQLWQG